MLPLPQRLPASLRTISSQPDLHISLQSMVCAYSGAPTSPALRTPPGENRTDGRCAQKTPGFRKITGVFSPKVPHFPILPRRHVSFAPDFGLQQVPNEMLSADGWCTTTKT